MSQEFNGFHTADEKCNEYSHTADSHMDWMKAVFYNILLLVNVSDNKCSVSDNKRSIKQLTNIYVLNFFHYNWPTFIFSLLLLASSLWFLAITGNLFHKQQICTAMFIASWQSNYNEVQFLFINYVEPKTVSCTQSYRQNSRFIFYLILCIIKSFNNCVKLKKQLQPAKAIARMCISPTTFNDMQSKGKECACDAHRNLISWGQSTLS